MEINIGFIGTGSIAISHVFSLLEIINNKLLFDKLNTKVKIFALSDTDEKVIQNLKQSNSIGPITYTTNPEDVLTDESINVIYINTPTKFHKDYYIRAAEEGKHVFVEKPLAFSVNDIKEMIAIQKKHGILTQVGLVLRYCPVFNKVKSLITENQNELGEVLGFTFRDDQKWPIGTFTHPSKWRKDPSLAHAGCLFEHSIHDVDILEFLLGDISKLKRLSANVRYISPLSQDRIEDSAILNLEYENGMSGNLLSFWHNISRDERRIEIFFENGSIILDGYEVIKYNFLHFYLKKRRKKLKLEKILTEFFEKLKYPQIPIQFYGYFFENLSFLESLARNEQPKPGLDIGLRAHDIIEKAYQSSKEKKFIDF